MKRQASSRPTNTSSASPRGDFGESESSMTKRDKARLVYLPQWLTDALEATCPLEVRTPERKVFQGITEASASQAMLWACRNAKVPH
jgi:hypothetical protein